MQEFAIINFKQDEFREIIERSKELITRGYFTGINLLQSEKELPQNSIIIHFLHDSQKHLEKVSSNIKSDNIIVPRFTYYIAREDYFKKVNFREEYKNAMFFDRDFNSISIDEAIKNPKDVTISNRELDLIIPLNKENNLLKIITQIQEADEGKEAWIDPVIIIRTKKPIKKLDSFLSKHYVSITRKNEEFYSILTDIERVKALEKYLNALCTKNRISELRRSDIIFYPSQINKEFNNYLSDIQNELNTFE